MRRRHFRVSLFVLEREKIKDITDIITRCISEYFVVGERKIKVTYIRQRPWWKIWR